MKKVFVTFIIIIVLMGMCIKSNAAFTVTEAQLEEEVKYILENGKSEEGYNIEDYIKINHTDKVIEVKGENENTYKLKYNLVGQPKFSIDFKFDIGMSKNEYANEYQKITLLVLGSCMVLHTQGINIEDSAIYFIKAIVDSSNLTISEKNYENAIEFAKDVCPKILVRDEIFKMSTSNTKETENLYETTVELEINNEADVSALNGFSEGVFNDIFDNMSGSLNLVSTNSNSVANINKIPKTGGQDVLVSSLKAIIFTCICIAAVVLICDKKKNI